MEGIKDILIRRDGMSPEAAEELIAEAKKSLQEYLSNGDFVGAEDVCAEFFGLEPDYVIELL